MKPKAYKFHPLSEIFPLLDAAELQYLADDIKANGQRSPICLFNGQILDGRNRYRACLLADVEPLFREFPGGDPVAFIVSANLRRRHLDTSQRATVAAKLATAKAGQPHKHQPGVEKNRGQLATIPAAAKLLNVSEHSVERAKQVLATAPKPEIEAIERDEKTVSKVLAAQKKQEKAEAGITDANNRTVPADLVPDWQRAVEVGGKLRSLMSQVKDTVANGINGRDVIFSELLNPTLAEIDALRYTLAQVIPHALCPTCQGRNRKNCTRCKRRGYLSKYLWTTTTSKAEKELAKKVAEARK